jgi:hypothetical protein
MIDEYIQRLKREIAAGGESRKRLALAAALQRTGRLYEACAALRPALDDPAIRRMLGAIAPGGGLFVDVPPLTERPKPIWSVTVPDNSARNSRPQVQASELGIVVTRIYGWTIHDPRNGAVLWSKIVEEYYDPPWIHKGVLLHWEKEQLVCYDLWTGVKLWKHSVKKSRIGTNVFLQVSDKCLTAHRFVDPRIPPQEELWSRPWHAKSMRPATTWGMPIQSSNAAVVLDPATGTELWRKRGGLGFVAEIGAIIGAICTGWKPPRWPGSFSIDFWNPPPRDWTLFNPNGEELWTIPKVEGRPIGLSPNFILTDYTLSDCHRTTVVSPSAAQPVFSTTDFRQEIVFVRGALYVEGTDRSSSPRLVALSPQGEEMWRITSEDHPGYFWSLAPLADRLFVTENVEGQLRLSCLA